MFVSWDLQLVLLLGYVLLMIIIRISDATPRCGAPTHVIFAVACPPSTRQEVEMPKAGARTDKRVLKRT